MKLFADILIQHVIFVIIMKLSVQYTQIMLVIIIRIAVQYTQKILQQ